MAISPLALNALFETAALQPLVGIGTRPGDVLLEQIASTQVTLSSFGRLQSVASGLFDTAAGLRAGSAPRDEAALAGALERFIAAANTGQRVTDTLLLRRLVGSLGIVDDSAALFAASALFRSIDLPARNGGVEFAALGISRQPDGQLALDREAFAAAFAADPQGVTEALDQLGRAVGQAAGDALAPGGGLARPPVDFELLFSSLRLQSLALTPNFGSSPADSGAALIRLTANPFLFGGVDAFRLIAAL